MAKSSILTYIVGTFFLCTGVCFGQGNVTLSGTVTDSTTNEALIGVTVQIKQTFTGTVSDVEGKYVIQAPEGATLIFSFIGYRTKEIVLSNQTILNVALSQESKALSEVVVIGYGVQRKSDLTGAVSSVRGEDLVKIPSNDPVQALQGKVAGVQVMTTSGAPGASAVVRVRGVGTFNNSSPIYVVDGVILDDISFINPADIQTMEVLKDASSTAIYGSRGANGVILVTTKQGRIGSIHPVVSATAEFSAQQIANKIDLLNGPEYATVVNEINPGSYNNVNAVPNTDWQDLIFRKNAGMQNHQISVAGASEKVQYYIGLGYFNQEGAIEKSKYERLTFRLNNTYTLAKYFKFGNNFTIAPYKQRSVPNVTYAAYRAQPVARPFFDDNSFGGVPNVGNPLASIAYSNDFGNGIRSVGNFFGDITFLKNFTFRSSLGLDMLYDKRKSFTPAYTVYNADGSPSQQQNVYSDLMKDNLENFSWLWENTLNYSKESGLHRINLLLGYTMQESRSERSRMSGENIIRDGEDFWYFRGSYLYDASNNINEVNNIINDVDPNFYYSIISYLFRANYTFNNKYLLTATYRVDGSSKFSTGSQYAGFPSLAAGWNIYQEEFLQNSSLVSNLKIRGSWGIIGNEKIRYNRKYSIVEGEQNAVFGRTETLNPGSTYGTAGNPDLKWESTNQVDIGLEVGLWNKLSGEFDFYRRVTNDILVDLSTPGHLGNGLGERVTYNAGEVLNQGFEFNLSWQDKIGELGYRIGFLGSTIKNEVLKVSGTGVDSTLTGGRLGNGQAVTLSAEGRPIGAFYGYQTAGVFQNDSELAGYPHDSRAEVGDLRFVDINNDGAITPLDRTYLGSSIPKFIYGINLEGSYRGFELSLDFQGQNGNKIFNGKDVVRPDPYNFEKNVINRWRGEGTSNSEPRPSFGGYNYSPSDRFIQDGSFFRLRNVTIGYSLPESFLKPLGIEKGRIYVRGTNVFTITKFTGYSPEIASGDVLSNGIDNGTYPIPTIYSAGMNISF